jgi:hypothetical protein
MSTQAFLDQRPRAGVQCQIVIPRRSLWGQGVCVWVCGDRELVSGPVCGEASLWGQRIRVAGMAVA